MSAGITTVGQLVAMSDADLRSLGRVNLKNIISRLDRLGLRLSLTKDTH
jgi:DNA-directed RNA polymerase alpha subunit